MPVWPDVWPLVMLMDAMRTRWDVAAGPARLIYTGLKYTDLDRPARACGVDLDAPGVWDLLRVAEAAALKHLNTHPEKRRHKR